MEVRQDRRKTSTREGEGMKKRGKKTLMESAAELAESVRPA